MWYNKITFGKSESPNETKVKVSEIFIICAFVRRGRLWWRIVPILQGKEEVRNLPGEFCMLL